MAATFYFSNQQILDSSGVPIVGATMESFVADTTTPLTTYADEALTTANPNPAAGGTTGNQFTASDGRFGNIFLQSLTYDFILKDADGAIIRVIPDYLPEGGVVVNIGDLPDTIFRVVGNIDSSKKLAFECDTDITTGTTRTVTVPDASGTMTLNTATQTLTNKTINLANNTFSATFAQLNTAVSDATLVDLVTSQTLTNKSINLANNTVTTTFALLNTAVTDGTLVGLTNTQTLTNKTFDLTDNTLTGTLAEFSTAVSDDSLVGLAATQTLTNKTINFANNTVSTSFVQLNTAVSDATLVGLTNTQTLTNKTFSLTANTLTGTLAELSTAISDASIAGLTNTQTLTNKTISFTNNTLSMTLAELNTAVSDATVVDLDDAQTLTNKTIDAASNTLSNFDTTMFAANIVDTDSNMAANSDLRLSSQKAIKAHVAAEIAAVGGGSLLTNVVSLTALLKASVGTGDFRTLKGYSTVSDNGGGKFRWNSTATDTDVAGIIESADEGGAGRWFRIITDGEVTPEMSGAIGDGTTDDTTAFYAVVSHCLAEGLTVRGRDSSEYYIPNGNATKVLTASGTYRWRRLNLTASTTLGGAVFIDFDGGDPSATSATPNANAYIGDSSTTFTADPGGSFAADDTVILIADRFYSDEGETFEPRVSEWLTISTITGAGPYTVTFTQPLKSQYTTADNFRMWRAGDAIKVDMEDLSLNGPGTSHNSSGMRFINCSDVILRDISAQNFYHTSYEFSGCARPRVTGLYARNSYLVGQGYGLAMGGCFEPQVTRLNGYRTRHLITLGDTASTNNVMGQGGTFSDLVGTRCLGAVVDSHSGHRDPVFMNVDAEGDTAGSGQEALVLESSGGMLLGCRVRGFNNASATPILLKNSGKPIEEGPATYTIRDIQMDSFSASSITGLFCWNNDTLYNNSMRVVADGIYLTAPQGVGFTAAGGDVFVDMSNSMIKATAAYGFYVYQPNDFHNIEVDLYNVDIDTRGTTDSFVSIISWSDKFERVINKAMTLSATTGTRQTATVGSTDTFVAFDLGSTIEETSGSGVGTIIAVDSGNDRAYIDITSAFAGTSQSSGGWKIVEPKINTPVIWHSGRSIKEVDRIINTACTLSATSGSSVTVTGVAGDFDPINDRNQKLRQDNGSAGEGTISSINDDGSVATMNVSSTFSTTTPGVFNLILQSSSAHFRTINGDIRLGAEVEIIGGFSFKFTPGGVTGDVYRHAAATIATS
ncbi:MAG: hypothetical protein JKY81_01505 [Colwellia sp.]|nr:hypothetical protein [Colwellia sp.]